MVFYKKNVIQKVLICIKNIQGHREWKEIGRWRSCVLLICDIMRDWISHPVLFDPDISEDWKEGRFSSEKTAEENQEKKREEKIRFPFVLFCVFETFFFN